MPSIKLIVKLFGSSLRNTKHPMAWLKSPWIWYERWEAKWKDNERFLEQHDATWTMVKTPAKSSPIVASWKWMPSISGRYFSWSSFLVTESAA